MQNKINILELLRDCPTGMELDCTMFEDVYFDHISDCGKFIYCYINYEDSKTSISFNKYGAYCNLDKSKCVIFPKNKNSWEGFRRPFKDGDIVATNEQIFILQRVNRGTLNNCYKGDCYTGYDFKYKEFFAVGEWAFERHATEKEKQKLFDVIKANGYKWNAETKTLEKLIEPVFKVGDKIRTKKDAPVPLSNIIITKVNEWGYHGVIGDTTNTTHISFEYQDKYELVPNKFDINTLVPFESKVLVRTENSDVWEGDIFVRYDRNATVNKFHCVGGWYEKCIPFNGNEWLLGTADDCGEYYKTWE